MHFKNMKFSVIGVEVLTWQEGSSMTAEEGLMFINTYGALSFNTKFNLTSCICLIPLQMCDFFRLMSGGVG